jgi:anti-sigma factor RsiW
MKQRDVEQLSSYLDGQLSPSDSARLKTRLASDPALASTLDALRESRSLLRRLPKRRAPRNFLLTPKMVGQKPPLPRSYPVFRFATALATLLFALSFVTNQVGQMAASAPMSPYGIGGGGGSDVSATEAPALAMAPAPATEAPVATEPPALAEESAPTQMAIVVPAATSELAADQNRAMEDPASPKTGDGEIVPSSPRPLLTAWQMGFGGIALLGAASMYAIQRLAARKWRGK